MSKKMQPRVIITVGISGSGKSTYAKNMVEDRKYCPIHLQYIEVNRDDTRSKMYPTLHFGDCSAYYNLPDPERFAMECMVSSRICENISDVLNNGQNVIISDTNLNQKYLNRLKEFLKEHHGIENVEVVFFDVDVDVAIERDKKRERVVGEQIIRKQFEMYKKLRADYEK